ncbi:MAG: hypothetical protein GX593_04980 [Actinomycetales bacterium]|nr:hypothetical protein [Actinomycetales bacterium]
MLGRWRKERAIRKVKPGDGRPLKPFRWWQGLYRSLYFLELADDDATPHLYAVDVPFFDLDGKVELYRDGAQLARSTDPATFPVLGGQIQVKTSTYGLARMHFVSDDGEERVLRPHASSAEGLRARFGARYPRTSAAIGALAVAILIVGLVLGLPQILEWASELPVIADNLGTFTSPITLPAWANTTLLVSGIVAAIERALTLRNHWLIDADTWFLGD